jgi:nucleotide-binding universal stress UspA family protein
MFEKVLAPLDGSELAERFLGQLGPILTPHETEVMAIRVLDGFDFDQAVLRGEDAFGIAGKQLEMALEPLGRAGAGTRYEVFVGDAATRILEAAADYRPSLIAMATHGRTGADRWLRGSVAERVLRRSPFPVFLANPRANVGAIRRILVPLDGSEMSATVLSVVHQMAPSCHAEVVLLHVIEASPGLYPTETLTETPDEALLLLELSRARLPGVDVRLRVAKGSPSFAILDAAKDGMDLVAMTTHGRSGPSRWVFGSVAEHVLHHLETPLLVVRTTGLSEGAPISANAASSASSRSER